MIKFYSTKSLRPSKAYSLLEILISLSIMSILAFVSFPSLMSFYQRKAEESALHQFLHALTYAHHEALIREIPVGVCQSKDLKTCMLKNKMGDWKEAYIVFLDLFGDGSIRNKTQVIAIREGIKLSGQMHYRHYPFYRAYLLFSPKKWLDNDNGAFWYCRYKNKAPNFAILITKSGKIRAVYPDKKGEIKVTNGEVLNCV